MRLVKTLLLVAEIRIGAQLPTVILNWKGVQNGQKVDIPSFQVSPGDEVEVRNSTSSRQLATSNMEATRLRNVPDWMTRNDEAFRGTVNRLPDREEMDPAINEQLIVEFYSRF